MPVELFRLFGIVDLQGNMALAQLKQINQQARKTGSTLGSIAKQAAGVAAGFGLWAGIQQSARALGSAFIGLNAQFEQAGIAFETMLGSGEKANAFLEDLEEFAARTPFQFPDLVDATQRMMALGFSAEEAIPTLQAVGDAAAALGKGKEGIDRIITALGQMRAKGKVSAEEMMQLTEAGVPAWEILAEATGKSTAEVQRLASEGLIPADRAVQALVAGMEARFPGMMDKLADSFEGTTSTIRDNLSMILKDMTKGLFTSLTETLRGVRDWTSQLRDAFKEGGLRGLYEFLVPPDLRRTLDPLIGSIRSAWGSIVDAAKRAGPVLADIGQTALRFLAPVGQVLVGAASAAARLAGAILGVWPALKPVIIGVAGAFVVLKTSMALEKVVKGASAALSGFVESARYQAKLFGMALRDSTGLVGKFKAAVAALTGVNPVFLAIGAAVVVVAGLAYELYKNWKHVPPFFRSLWEAVKGAFGVGGAAIVVALREIQLGLAKALNFMLGNVVKFGAKVATIFESLPGVGRIAGAVRQALEGAGETFRGFEEASARALDAAKSDLAGAMKDFGAAWEELKQTGATLGKAIGGDLKAIFTAAKGQVAAAFGSVLPGLKKTSDAAGQEGKKGADAFAGSWEAGGKKAEKAIEGLVSALESAIRTAGNTLGEGTEKAALQMQNALEVALMAVNALGKAGGPVAAKLREYLTAAASQVRAAVVDRSEEAALALMRNLSQAAALAAQSIKGDGGEAAQSLRAGLAEAAQEVEDRFRELAEEAKRTQIEAIDNLHELIVNALRRRYEEEKSVRTKAIRDAIDAERARVDVILREIDRERRAREEATTDPLRLRIRSIWAEIDALDELTRKEEEEARNAEELARIMELQAKIAEETDPEEIQRLRVELARAEQDRQRRLLLAQREERKKELEKQLEDIRFQQEEAFREFEEAKNKELDYLENVYYPQRLKDAALNAEAEKMMLAQNQAEILKLLKTYGEGWKDLGITFGKRLLEGIGPYMDELNKMVASALAAVGGAKRPAAKAVGKYAEQVKSVSEEDLARLRANSQRWFDVQNPESPAYIADPEKRKTEQERLHAENVRIQGKYGIPEEASRTVIEWRKMHEGGLVARGSLAEVLRSALALKPREVPVILEEGEIVLPRSFRLPDLAALRPPAAPAVAFVGPPVFNFNSCVFQDGAEAGRRAFDAFWREMRRRGL